MRRVVAVVVLATAAVLALFLLVRTSSAPNSEPTTNYTLPGYRVTLPSWKGNVGAKYWFDALHLEDPTGGGRFIELRWSAGPPEPETAVTMAQQMMKAKVVAREPATVAGQKTEIVYLEELQTPPKAFAFTPFDCNDGRSAFLLTFLNQDKETLLATHRRALATIACAKDPQPARGYPKVQLPAGMTMDEKTSGRSYTAASNDHRYFFSSGVPGAAFANDFARNDGLRQQVIAAEFGAQRVELEPLRVDGGLATGGVLWSGTASLSDGKTVKVLATAFHCPGTDESHFAYHVDQRAGVDDAAVQPLATATCP